MSRTGAPSQPPTRRAFVHAALWVLPIAAGLPAYAAPPVQPSAALAELERVHGGRLGVCVLDTGTNARLDHRGDERFAMCSTFKLTLSALVLARVDRGEERLDRALPVREADLVPHSPITGTRVGATMTLAELCHATLTTSDNAAANLILSTVGGPAGLTTFARSLGDAVTRLDRLEPELNVVGLAEGDERDTTTPIAMAALVRRLALGDALRADSRATLVGWMRETTTGLSRLRKHLPADWTPGDKTGTGPDGPTNDVAVAWPPGRAPLVVTAYYDRAGRTMAENEAVLAEVGRIVASIG